MCDFGISESALAATFVATAVVSAISTALGTTFSVIAANNQAAAQEAQYNYQAQVQQQNVKIANENAAMERQTGLEEARRQRIKTLQAIGEQTTSLAANGLDVGFGTSLDIIEDTAMMGELDALMIETQAERTARNYEIQANNFANEANLSSYAARNARSAGTTNAIATGLGGLGKSLSSVGSMASGGFGSLGSGATKRVSGSIVSGGIRGDSSAFA